MSQLIRQQILATISIFEHAIFITLGLILNLQLLCIIDSKNGSTCTWTLWSLCFNPLTRVTKTEFPLTMLLQYQAEKWQKQRKWGDYQLIQYQIFPSNIIRIVWQIVRRITIEFLGVKGLTGLYLVNWFPLQSCNWWKCQKEIHDEDIRSSQKTHNTIFGIIFHFRCIFISVCPKEFDHDWCGLLTVTKQTRVRIYIHLHVLQYIEQFAMKWW